MPYKVVHRFADLQDNNRIYEVGDEYPRKNFKVDKKRYEELAGVKNAMNVALIEEVKDVNVDTAEVNAEPNEVANKPADKPAKVTRKTAK